MGVQGLVLRFLNLPERMELLLDAGVRPLLVSSENKRDLADVLDEVLNKLRPIFDTDPLNAAIRAMELE